MHVALDFMGRNSAYSVTLAHKAISQLGLNPSPPFGTTMISVQFGMALNYLK